MPLNKHLISSISYSAYRDYKKCPKLFYYRKVLKLKLDEEPINLIFGSAIHTALELNIKEGKDLLVVFRNEFTREQLPSMDEEEFFYHLNNGCRLLKYWRENKKEAMKEYDFAIKDTEVPFELKVDKDPLTGMKLDIPVIRGVVDFTTSKIKGLGDYKTSTKKYTQEMVDTSDQPTFYYLWYLQKYGKLPDAFFYIVFRKKIKKVPLQILKTTRTMKQVSDLLADIQHVILQIDNREFNLRHKDGEFCDCVKYEEMLNL